MKQVISVSLWFVLAVALVINITGCATRAERAEAYCDANRDKFNSYQECYDRKVQQHNVVGAFAKGFSESNRLGQQPVQQFNRTVTCQTYGSITTCN